MKDISKKYQSHIKEKINQVVDLQSNQSYFNIDTHAILVVLNFLSNMMHTSREQYFSYSILVPGSFTEAQKEEFDNKIINSIKLCKSKVLDLQHMLKEQKSFLYSKNKSEYAHKELSIGCLMSKLNQVTTNFKEFKSYRSKQKERALNLTRYKSTNKREIKPVEQSEDKESNPTLALENKMLFLKYNDNMEDIMKAQEQIKDISQLIGKMSETLYRQDLTTDQILGDAQDSLKHIEQANKNLIDATKLNEKMGSVWALLFLGMAFTLLFFDFINS